jgi:hypothetical protein
MQSEHIFDNCYKTKNSKAYENSTIQHTRQPVIKSLFDFKNATASLEMPIQPGHTKPFFLNRRLVERSDIVLPRLAHGKFGLILCQLQSDAMTQRLCAKALTRASI